MKKGLTEGKTSKAWLARQAESEAKKDVMSTSERAGSVVAVVGFFIVLIFFNVHQTWQTGFFTEKFGPTEEFLFFGSIALAGLTIAGRIAVGRKNVIRPLDTVFLAWVAVATIWLYVVFPFDFSHLADVLPSFVRFILAWISDDIARLVMILQILGSSFFAVYTATLYVYVRKELRAQKISV